MTDRERLLLWRLMEHDIYRYLIVNSHGRENGAEKSNRHISLVKTFMSYWQCRVPIDSMIIEDEFDIIHQHTKSLTDNLDKIGLPLDETRPAYDILAKLFFNRFVELCFESIGENK